MSIANQFKWYDIANLFYQKIIFSICSNDWTVAKIYELPLKDGNITPEKARKSRRMQLRDKTAYVLGLRYRWDPLLSRKPLPRFPHFMPPWSDYIFRFQVSNVRIVVSRVAELLLSLIFLFCAISTKLTTIGYSKLQSSKKCSKRQGQKEDKRNTFYELRWNIRTKGVGQWHH